MSREQRENPEGKAIMDRFRAANPGGKVSGAKFENFREGWAHEVWVGGYSKVGHYFRRRLDDISLAVAKCGRVAVVGDLHAPGTFPRCARCSNAMARRVG